MLVVQIEGRQRQRRAFQTSEALLDQVLFAVGMDGFRQRQFVGVLVACVNAPTQPTYSLLQSRLVNRGVHGDLFFMHRGGRACAVGTFASFQHVALDFEAQELGLYWSLSSLTYVRDLLATLAKNNYLYR